MTQYDYLIIGGGIAGASLGYRIAGEHKVALLEQEDQPGYHTTGRSVAVWTTAYGPAPMRALCNASIDFIRNPPEGFAEYELYHPTGLMFIATDEQRQDLLDLLAAVRQLAPEIHEISVDEALEKVPVLSRDHVKAAFYDPGTLGLDVATMHQGFLRGIKASGGDVVCKAEAQTIERRDGLWHVSTPSGDFCAPVIINAAGAWADVVAEKAGVEKINIVPKRRTVVSVDGLEGLDAKTWPGVMDAHENFYFKVDGGALVASPADETPDLPRDVQPEELDIAITVDHLQHATNLDIRRVTSSWAGLRSFVEDRLPVVGYAPDAEGFFWFAGQGGYGIATSPALGECGAALLKGEDLPEYVKEFGISKEQIAPGRDMTEAGRFE
ncbi:FAD-binding oxidoreductase [Pseudomaricurvus alkylphenolicus]|uniref:NAD(P)/FAD-dependent oxidoreductase n=1 Tax=Pseudomaricurvus alkylphenolicus TaxID=1306991 RepID=UPI001420E279|nr:FAD-binding oxidoreductase [Pseudomaricurvus alkylphenolicus]NIB38047.1 FAD-binding oxidoreductase [Pseudomaricurvus alkylphenolicus]